MRINLAYTIHIPVAAFGLFSIFVLGSGDTLMPPDNFARRGTFVYISGAVEKIFVDTEGDAHNILKGGIFVDVNSDGLCVVRSKVEREGVSNEVLYGVNCTRMVATNMKCPAALVTADTCRRQDVDCMSDSLHQNGYVVMEGPVAGFPGSHVANEFANSKYVEMLRIAETRSLDPHALEFHFSDVSSRGPGRWEMQVRGEDLLSQSSMVSSDTNAESSIHKDLTQSHWLPSMWDAVERDVILPALTAAVAKDWADSASSLGLHSLPQVDNTDGPGDDRIGTATTSNNPAQLTAHSSTASVAAETTVIAFDGDTTIDVLPAVAFTAVFDGVLLSAPGADTQHWHRDSGLHARNISHYTIYIPTVDVKDTMGPTEFLPGTHRDFAFVFEDWTSFFDYCDTKRVPLLGAGDMLIWEYRTIHRGTRNIESNRPMLYRTYHLDGTWRDINMGDISFYNPFLV